MTDDPITAALQQLADHHEQLTQLTELITGIGDTLREHESALAKLAEPLPPTPTTPTATAPARRPRGGNSRPLTAANPSPGCAPGSSRSTIPATAT